MPESHSEGPDWLRASGRQGNGVLGTEEVCAQRSGSTQLHVSQPHVLLSVECREQVGILPYYPKNVPIQSISPAPAPIHYDSITVLF